ncbi:MAG: hypothetical protein GY934_10230, partial [Gammaproteobacteria bacterium]|nr:hypothetical protein [Gammaproteobacteria bacterium]
MTLKLAAIQASRSEHHPYIWRFCQLLLVFILTATLPGLTAQAQESLEDVTKQYETVYREFLELKSKRDKYPPDSDERQVLGDQIFNRQRILDVLKRAVTELGGNVNAIEQQVKSGSKPDGLKVTPDSEIELSLEETKEKFQSPEDHFPWKIKNWPQDARSMSDNNRLYIVLRTLEQYQTEWASKHRRLLETMNPQQRWDYYYEAVKGVYEDIYNITFEVQAVSKPDLKKDAKRFTRGFADNAAFAKQLLNETLDKYTATTKSKASNWQWLDLGLRSSEVHKEYEQAQKKMRRILLTEYDKWDKDLYQAWEGEMSSVVNEIIGIERKMIWLLGYSKHSEKLPELEKLYRQKIEILPTLQEKFVSDYIGVRHFEVERDFHQITPYSSPKGGVDKDEVDKANKANLKRLQSSLAATDQKVGKLIDDLRKAVKKIGGRDAI